MAGPQEGTQAAAARLATEIADLSRELAALPLAKSNRDARLKLNDLKRSKEAELAEVMRGEKLERLQVRLREIDVELHALEKGPATRDRRQQLLQEQRVVRKELELAERGDEP